MARDLCEYLTVAALIAAVVGSMEWAKPWPTTRLTQHMLDCGRCSGPKADDTCPFIVDHQRRMRAIANQ